MDWCDRSIDHSCPADGRYQYNTDLVFDRTGSLLTTYHKYNLYGEKNFNQPALKRSTFNLPGFGTIGTYDRSIDWLIDYFFVWLIDWLTFQLVIRCRYLFRSAEPGTGSGVGGTERSGFVGAPDVLVQSHPIFGHVWIRGGVGGTNEDISVGGEYTRAGPGHGGQRDFRAGWSLELYLCHWSVLRGTVVDWHHPAGSGGKWIPDEEDSQHQRSCLDICVCKSTKTNTLNSKTFCFFHKILLK